VHLLILGRGKTGTVAAEVARERKHDVRILGASDNPDGSALTAEKLRDVDMVIDLTTPHAVTHNMHACIQARKSMVVGTTGWYQGLPSIRTLVENSGTGFLWGSNFSVGVNLFFEIVHKAADAFRYGYYGEIIERHHSHKKDAPSGTAITIQKLIHEISGQDVKITSFREGDIVAMHELRLESASDTIHIHHDAKSRRGFAEGAVRGAEWLVGKKGFFNFSEIWQQLCDQDATQA